MASTTIETNPNDSAGHVRVREFAMQWNGQGNEKKTVVGRRGDITDFVGKATVNDGALNVHQDVIVCLKHDVCKVEIIMIFSLRRTDAIGAELLWLGLCSHVGFAGK
jgi:hypothetical protein